MRPRDLTRSFPILCRHWPNFPASEDESPPHVRDLKLRRDVELLHRLPARVTFELLCEIGATRQIQTYVEQRTAEVAAVDPYRLAATGGDRFPPLPLRELA